MSFPYLHANGGICCSTRTQCCPKCEAKLAAEKRDAVTPKARRAASLRTAVPHGDAPPNPYASVMRRPLTPDLDPNYDPATGAPPDGYAIHLTLDEVLREQAAERTPTPRTASARPVNTIVTNGIPDGYATAFAEERNRS